MQVTLKHSSTLNTEQRNKLKKKNSTCTQTFWALMPWILRFATSNNLLLHLITRTDMKNSPISLYTPNEGTLRSAIPEFAITFLIPKVYLRNKLSWNKVKCQLDARRSFYWCILSSTCFGYIRPSSGALDVELQHMVFCTEFLDGWWWSWEPLRRSCERCGWYRIRNVQYTRPTQRPSGPPPIYKLGAENHTLQLNI